MNYRGNDQFSHESDPVTGVLLVNLGTPDAPDRRSVRRYLKQFLSDPRVVEYPRWLWWLILNGIILNVRPSRSAKAYREVWTKAGSPLKVHSMAQLDGVRGWFQQNLPGEVRIELAMTYGEPSVETALAPFREQFLNSLIVLPLYPQYSGSTTGAVFDQVGECLRRWRWVPPLRFINGYHDAPSYIECLRDKIRTFWDENGRNEHLLISFHGVPRRYLVAGDPYYCQCHKTARLLADELALEDNQWSMVFQSRFGREEWLKPYCDHRLQELAADGVRSVDVICPGFASDCLETLEEIDGQYRQLFLDAGGEKFAYIPCLNSDEAHIRCLAELVTGQSGPIIEPDPASTSQRNSLALAAGAKR